MKAKPVIYLCAPGRDTAAVSQRVREMLEARDCEVLFHPPALSTRLVTRGYCRIQRRPKLIHCDALLQLVGRDSGPMLQRDEEHEDPCSLAVWEGQEAAHFHKAIGRLVLGDGLLQAPAADAKPVPAEQLRYQANYRRRLQKAPQIASETELEAFLERWVEALRPQEIEASVAPAVEAPSPVQLAPVAEHVVAHLPLAPEPPLAEVATPSLAPEPIAEPAELSGPVAAEAPIQLFTEALPVESMERPVEEAHAAPIPATPIECQQHVELEPPVSQTQGEAVAPVLAEANPVAILEIEPAPVVLCEAPPVVLEELPVTLAVPEAAPLTSQSEPTPSPVGEATSAIALEAEESLAEAEVEAVAFPQAPPLLVEAAESQSEPEPEAGPAPEPEYEQAPEAELCPEPQPVAKASPAPTVRPRATAAFLKRSRSAVPMKVEFAFFTHTARTQLRQGKRLEITSWQQRPQERAVSPKALPAPEAPQPAPAQPEIAACPPPQAAAPAAQPKEVQPPPSPVPLQEHLLWPAEQAQPDEEAPAAASASAHYAQHMVWPSVLPDRDGPGPADPAEEEEDSDFDMPRGRMPTVPPRIYVQLSMAFGAFVIAAILAIVSLWQTISHHRARTAVDDFGLAQVDQVPTVPTTPSAPPVPTESTPALPAPNPVAVNEPVSRPAPGASVEPEPVVIAPGQRQQEVEQGLADVIQTLRQQPNAGGPNLTGAHAKLFLAIQLDLDQTLRQLSNEKERGNPKLFQVSRDLAMTRLLAAEFPAARNCLLDLRDQALQVHGNSHAETLLTYYLLAMTDLMEGLKDQNPSMIAHAEATLRSAMDRLKMSARVSNKGQDAFAAAIQCCETARAHPSPPRELAQWVRQRFPMTASESEALLTSLQWGLQTQN